MSNTAIPSLEDIVHQKRQREEERARPKFLSKAERAKLAIQRREQQVQEQRARLDTQRQALHLANGQTNNGRENDSSSTRSRSPAISEKTQSSHNITESETTTAASTESADDPDWTIKQRYMGIKPPVKKKRRNADKKFVFDWDTSDDTSASALPNDSHDQLGVFGRGKLGGFDETEIRKTQQHEALIQRLLKGSPEDQRRAHMLIEQQKRKTKKVDWDDVPWYQKPLEAMKPRDWRILKEDFGISVKGDNLPNPLRNWEESSLPEKVQATLKKVKYKEPSAIQRAAIPLLLQRNDIIGIAETGSGKTAAFVIPLVTHISRLPALDDTNMHLGPYAIILAPTRELAQQIQVEASKFSEPLGLRCVAVVGGHAFEEQSFQMSQGAHIVVATPGRLVDCLERRVFVLSQCYFVVMDEADRMVDMGFEEDVNKALTSLPPSGHDDDEAMVAGEDLLRSTRPTRARQTVMFSATLPTRVENLAKRYLNKPIMLTIGTIGQAVDRVEQRVEMIADDAKRRKRLEEILNTNRYAPPIVVFVNLKRNCESLAKALYNMGWRVVTLHGSKSQEQRERAIEQLRNHSADILVATDLAGRGIDIPNVSLVVNYNMAKSIEDYTHRIGRTGRAGKHGTAITFLGPEDTGVYYDLRLMLSKSANSHIPEELRRHEAALARPNIVL
ncbi:U5 snRNP-associated protein Prp28 [Schizosaccharomyces japonicus yFS275]|uniref:RNA helicase n=1 Tax=Schizosaccharomyces japonicus (strain yFS275 / FY16936) TaxID=402676 RepID=B6K6A2_SCHJY|nr:U5 snRNP-associated protein Prp28 [Schizosaccharomyces japonicus yFS275]EEB09056.1 U5 snRNP-associated protein Prp28 [Schizosaccharomyces japonicus yFS275]